MEQVTGTRRHSGAGYPCLAVGSRPSRSGHFSGVPAQGSHGAVLQGPHERIQSVVACHGGGQLLTVVGKYVRSSPREEGRAVCLFKLSLNIL